MPPTPAERIRELEAELADLCAEDAYAPVASKPLASVTELLRAASEPPLEAPIVVVSSPEPEADEEDEDDFDEDEDDDY